MASARPAVRIGPLLDSGAGRLVDLLADGAVRSVDLTTEVLNRIDRTPAQPQRVPPRPRNRSPRRGLGSRPAGPRTVLRHHHIGPAGRTVEDAALLLNVLAARPDAPFGAAARRDPGRLRIALVPRSPFSGYRTQLDPRSASPSNASRESWPTPATPCMPRSPTTAWSDRTS
ncbi:MAG TPA: hypothetical protein VHZ97_25400 [Pseudonocardiaceae bacterium]|nr:hypothetical protein [Pseudonocardiaceae bacterium]